MSDQPSPEDVANMIRSTPAIKVDQPELPGSVTYDDRELAVPAVEMECGHWELFNPPQKYTHTATWAHYSHADARKLIASERRRLRKGHTSDSRFPKKARNRKNRLFLKGWRTRYVKPVVVEFTEVYGKSVKDFMREWVSHLQGTTHPEILAEPPSVHVRFTNPEAEKAFVEGIQKVMQTTPPPATSFSKMSPDISGTTENT
jgi:hypothetical protein